MDLDGTVRPGGGTTGTPLLTQLASLRRNGVKVVLVTGRALRDLQALVDVRLFDALVVENGAILVVAGVQKVLAPPGWPAERRKLLRFFSSTGHEEVIVALRRENVAEARAIVGYRARLEFNKDAMMILPRGVSKGSGLLAALAALGVPARETMCIGDGENDVPLLRAGGVRVAVRNAVDALKREADYVTAEEDGRGVSEAISRYCGAAGWPGAPRPGAGRQDGVVRPPSSPPQARDN